MNNHTEFLRNFITSYDGKPIVFVVTGAGMSLAELTLLPGSSKVVEGIIIPYGNSAFQANVAGLVRNSTYSRVSPEITKEYFLSPTLTPYSLDTPIVVVNGALITNRYRRGEHHAYFIVDCYLYHVVLPKETEEEWNDLNDKDLIHIVRAEQDRAVAQLVLSVVQGNIPPFDDTFQRIGETA